MERLNAIVESIVREILAEGYYDRRIPNYQAKQQELYAYKERLNTLKESLINGIIGIVQQQYPEIQLNPRVLKFAVDPIMTEIQNSARNNRIRL